MTILEDNQTYSRKESAVFLRTAEQFGGLSNMAAGYTLCINGVRILTSEALYQACRFPHKPDIQKLIIGQKSPMTAKMVSKPHRQNTRPDWDAQRISIMRWCLHVKLAQHWEKFGDLLLSTGHKPIVEESYRDQFWGAKPLNSETLSGMNVLGQLLMELREQFRCPEAHNLRIVEPLPDFLFLGKTISVIEAPKPASRYLSRPTLEMPTAIEQDTASNGTPSAETPIAVEEATSTNATTQISASVPTTPHSLAEHPHTLWPEIYAPPTSQKSKSKTPRRRNVNPPHSAYSN